MLPFKDISYAQGLWNMDTDPDPIVAIKASGVYTSSKVPYIDVQLVRNYADAVRLGKVPILYHFCGGGDPVTEAAYFIAAIHPLAENDVYALDYEFDVADPVGWVNTFMTKVHDATGAWPLLYIDISRLNAHDWTPVLKNCGLWLAAPSYGWDQNAPVSHPYVAQQGPIVNGVDTDMWFGTLDALKQYGYHAPVAPPAPAPSPAPPPPPPPTPVVPTPPPEQGSGQPTPEPTPVVVVPPTTPSPAQSWISRFISWLKHLFGIGG